MTREGDVADTKHINDKNVKKRKIKIVTIRWLKNYEELSCDSVILILGIYTKWKQGLSPYVCLFVHQNHSSIILKIQKIDIIEVFIDRWTDKQNVAWTYDATPIVLKEARMQATVLSAAWAGVEENWDTGFSVNKTSRHFVRNKPITKQQMQHDPNNLRILKHSHSYRKKKNSNWNTGNNRELMFSGCKIIFAARREHLRWIMVAQQYDKYHDT